MELDKLKELIEVFQKSGLSEIELEEDGRRVRLTKFQQPAPAQQIVHVPAPVHAMPHAHAVSAPPAAAQEAPPPSAAVDDDDGLVTIDSPMVGVFYAAPAPGEDPFIKVGDTVQENQPVCIVEAMKLMNEVTAKFAGVVEKILVENGEPVEYNQPLFAIRLAEQA
ncbi:MAG: acetyl-CoA carboxylase biotin carboxyl carrier protein subunit [Candidatus Hydrogenedentota bacterium]